MKNLKIQVGARATITFSSTTVIFLRDINSSKTATVNYINGSNQTIQAGQVLYTEGTENTLNYIKITSTNNATLIGSGSLSITIKTYPNSTQVNKTLNLTLVNNPSPLVINLTYNSKPVAADMVLSTPNRTTRIIRPEDILPNVSDFDGDAITDIMFYGNVSAIRYNGNPYVEGTFIPFIDLSNNLLTVLANDQNEPYDINLQYSVKDAQGNTSN